METCVLKHSCVFVVFSGAWWQPFLSGYYMLAASPTTRLAAKAEGKRGGKKAVVVMFLHSKYDAVYLFQAPGSLLIDFVSQSIFMQSGLNLPSSLPIRRNAFSTYAVFMSRYWPFHVWNTVGNISFSKIALTGAVQREFSLLNLHSVISIKIKRAIGAGTSEDIFPLLIWESVNP